MKTTDQPRGSFQFVPANISGSNSLEQFLRVGINVAPDPIMNLYLSSTREPGAAVKNCPNDTLALIEWIPSGFSTVATAAALTGYYKNTTSVVSATKHGIGLFGMFEDTANGALVLGIGAEGYVIGYGVSSYVGVFGHVLYRNATVNNAAVCAGFMSSCEITLMDGVTPLASGLVASYYAPAIIGGAAATKYSFLGFDQIKAVGEISSFNSANTKRIYLGHDGTNGSVSVSSGALSLIPAAGQGILIGAGVYLAPIVAGGVDLGLGGFEFGNLRLLGDIISNTGSGIKFGTATTQKIGFLGSAPVVQQTQGATLTNNITAGGSANTLANFTDLTTYSNSAAAIRNDLYQIGVLLKTVVDALRLYGLLS